MITANEVKLSLRLTSGALDGEIEDTMAAALLDMQRVGISSTADNELTDMLVKLYCKWQFNYNEKGEQYQKNYLALRDSLSLSSGYKEAT